MLILLLAATSRSRRNTCQATRQRTSFVRPAIIVALLAAWSVAGSVPAAASQDFRIERIASGLNQPTYVTQAPGDPANILYYTERTSNTIGGFGAINQMGKIWRYDVNTRDQSLVLDLSNRTLTNDDGLQTIAFSPDFNTPGAPGYQKMYVSLAEIGTSALNKVEEYTVPAGLPATLDRVILQYSNNTQNNHTVNWIGFDPTATGEARNFLHISTGDGSFGSPYGSGSSPGGRPSQNPTDLRGKILRVDVDPTRADAYPADPNKNFAIPATNPIAAYNAANPGSPLMIVIPGVRLPLIPLAEVFVTGVRNGYRASFDRATGDLYFGDVGEFAVEEVDVLKAGTNTFGYPVDFGWPQREGTFDSGVPGAPDATINPFTGIAALEPIQQFPHFGGGNAVIGGYVYRGPIAELEGKYFFADFVGNGRIGMLDFDRDTDPTNYNGDNGLLTEVTDLWQSLVTDPTDPSYLPDSTAASIAGLDHIVSFGEDNAGNMYLVDFGNGSGFNGQYPGAGRGEIFRLTPIPEPTSLALAALALLPLALGRPRLDARPSSVGVVPPPL